DANAAARQIDDALEGEIVVGRLQDAQVSQRVPDLLAFVEARAADHAIRQPQRDEPLLEFAGLESGAHQDRYRAERHALVLQRLDLLADQARFLLTIPDAAQSDLLAFGFLGPQGLAESPLVMG